MTARHLWPSVRWLAIEGDMVANNHHSTVIAPMEGWVFDPYFQFIRTTADECVAMAKSGEYRYSEHPIPANETSERIGRDMDFDAKLAAGQKYGRLREEFRII